MPRSLVRAYDQADGNRSALMRRVLSEAVENGDLVDGVPDDLRTLAAVETAVDDGRLERRRGTFRQRVTEFFRDKYRDGFVTPEEAEDMAQSWYAEADHHGPEYVEWVDVVVGWYRENWDPQARPEWPGPEAFHYMVGDGDGVELNEYLVNELETMKSNGADADTALARVRSDWPENQARAAVAEVFDGAE